MIIAGAALTVLLFYFLNLYRNWNSGEMMNRAQIARMLALMRYTSQECETIQGELAEEEAPEDLGTDQWYGKYVAAVLREGWMTNREDGRFYPAETFTYGDLTNIMERFHISETSLSFSLKYRQRDGMVPKSQWCEVYQLLCVNSPGIKREVLNICGSPENITGMEAWQVLTRQGIKKGEGISVHPYMDQTVEAYTAGEELVCIIGRSQEESRLENVWIESGEGKELKIFFNGYERQLSLGEDLEMPLEENMADLTFTNGKLTALDYKTSRIKSALTGIEGNEMILQDYGRMPLSENLVIYRIYPALEVLSREALATDGTVYEFVLEGNQICGIIYQNYAQETLRVLLHGASADSYEQSEVTVTSEMDFLVIAPEETTRYEAGTEVTLTPEDVGEEEVRIQTESPEGRIQVTSLERSFGNPSYHGSICIQNSNGLLLIVNEVGLEDYVAGVIPGEMPVSYGMEALKVQAVCARTFGRRAIGTSFRDYPANLDDTVSSQVYNAQEECSESIQAAAETRGQVLQDGEGLTATYFFSTSCGHTSDPEDVWYSGGEEANGEAASVFLSDDRVSLALSQEEDFRKFINQEDGYRYFEEDLPWFRWQTYLSAEDIRVNVQNVCQIDIGELQSISVLERAESGLLKAIHVEGSMDQCTVYGEYQIRQIFSPMNGELTPQSGESVTGWRLLPSAYCYMDAVIEEDRCQGYMIRGGGYGHGSGMSQNGAMKMAEMGKGYEEILKYFFPDSELITE